MGFLDFLLIEVYSSDVHNNIRNLICCNFLKIHASIYFDHFISRSDKYPRIYKVTIGAKLVTNGRFIKHLIFILVIQKDLLQIIVEGQAIDVFNALLCNQLGKTYAETKRPLIVFGHNIYRY